MSSSLDNYNEKLQNSTYSSFSSAIKAANSRIEKNNNLLIEYGKKAKLIADGLDQYIGPLNQVSMRVSAATKDSPVGAAECKAGIQKAIKNIIEVKQKLGSGISISALAVGGSYGGGGDSANMIHVGGWLNKARSELNTQADVIQGIAAQIQGTADRASGIGQSDDIAVLAMKMSEETNEVLKLAHYIQAFAAALGEIQAEYLQLQTEALNRAMQIPG